MALERRTINVPDIRKGVVAQDAIYKGTELIWTHEDLPQITDFGGAPPYLAQGTTGRNLQLAFIVANSNSNQIHSDPQGTNANVPLTGDTGALVAAPASDTLYRLTCANSAGTVHRDWQFFRVVAPTITATFGTVQVAGSGVVPRIQVSVTMHPWRETVLTLSPEVYGFTQASFQRLASRTGDTRSVLLQGNPRQATQPTVSADVTLTAGLRFSGVVPSIAPDATATVTVRY